MARNPLKLALGVQADRTSPRAAATNAKAFQDSGVVDEFLTWDQLTSWAPTALWRPEYTPLAEVVKDTDSFADAFVLAAFGSAGAPGLGLSVTTDSIRRGPAELMQSMLTLAAATEGRASLLLGAGEAKQVKPYGYRRADGLARFEDYLRIFELLWASEGLVSFKGNLIEFNNAWIGGVKPYRPRFLAMGGGPKLIDLAAKYADGLVTTIPNVFQSPEQWEVECKRVRKLVEENDRDPDAFTMGFWVHGQWHEDVDFLKSTWTNPIMKWQGAIYGRLNMNDWDKSDIESVMPKNFHYALNLLPAEMKLEDCLAITDAVTPEMMEKTYIYGTPNEVAKELKDWVDAGADWIAPFDMTPQMLAPEEATQQVQTSIELCRLLKALVGSPVAVPTP